MLGVIQLEKQIKKNDTIAADVLQNETASLLGKFENDPKNAALYSQQIVENLAKLEAGTSSGREGNWNWGGFQLSFLQFKKSNGLKNLKIAQRMK